MPDSGKVPWGLMMEALVNGIHLHYVQAGNGIPLLLIHGYPLDHALWQPQVDGLADANAARVIAPDLRGFGQSDAPKGAYTMETYADDLGAPRTEVLGRYIAAHRLACLACDRRRLNPWPLGGGMKEQPDNGNRTLAI